MIVAYFLLLVVLLAPLVLVGLLRPALRYVEDPATPWWRLDLALCAIVAWVADVVAARTLWPVLAGWPCPHELTISHTLERLCQTPGPDRQAFVELARWINRRSPTGRHIEGVL